MARTKQVRARILVELTGSDETVRSCVTWVVDQLRQTASKGVTINYPEPVVLTPIVRKKAKPETRPVARKSGNAAADALVAD